MTKAIIVRMMARRPHFHLLVQIEHWHVQGTKKMFMSMDIARSGALGILGKRSSGASLAARHRTFQPIALSSQNQRKRHLQRPKLAAESADEEVVQRRLVIQPTVKLQSLSPKHLKVVFRAGLLRAPHPVHQMLRSSTSACCRPRHGGKKSE